MSPVPVIFFAHAAGGWRKQSSGSFHGACRMMPSHTSSKLSMAISLALAFRSEEQILLGHVFISIHVIVGLCQESNSELVISRRSTVPIPIESNQANLSLSRVSIPRFRVTLAARFTPE